MADDELIIESTAHAYARTAWLTPGPPVAHALCVMLDGEFYRDKVDAPAILSSLMQRGLTPPMTVVFVSHGGAAARHTDYVCEPLFARFIAEDVVNHARARVPSLSADGHVICGLSLSGLAAAHITLLYPTRFPAALCQSGSFWYQPAAFAQLAHQHAPSTSRFWLSVGDEETATDVTHPPTGIFQSLSQLAGVDRARAALAASGADVHYHRFHGGHAFEPWRAELGDALQWLLRTV